MLRTLRETKGVPAKLPGREISGFSIASLGGMMKRMRRLAFLQMCCICCCIPAGICVSCNDSSSSKDRASRFSSSAKPAPNPRLDPLEDFMRTSPDESELPHYKYPLYSAYQGEDIVQLTGVSGRTLLLCFGAPWCPNTQKMNAALEKLAAGEQGAVQVVTVDADAYPELAQEFRISRIPATFIYVEGVRLQKVVGFYGTEVFRAMLKRALIPTQENKRSR